MPKAISVRKIIHIDMDAFFASIEQRDHLHYQHQPVIVGGQPGSRGVVAACSYEARKYGIHSAMPSSHAFRLCPQAIFVRPRLSVYRDVSITIHHILHQYTSQIEPISLDEAYLDVSGLQVCHGSATYIAQKIKQQIWSETGLIASAGISYNKFLAKIASDIDKPNGLYLITPHQGENFVAQLPIEKFHGVGQATTRKMHALGIYYGADLKRFELSVLQYYFGKSARFFFQIARGVDERPLRMNRERQSMGTEMTYPEDLQESDIIYQQLAILLEKSLRKLQEKQLFARTLTIKIKYSNFHQITRSLTLQSPIIIQSFTTPLFRQLLNNENIGHRKIRLLGVTLSTLENNTKGYQQMDLFDKLI